MVIAQPFCSRLWLSFTRAYGSRGFPDGSLSRAATRAKRLEVEGQCVWYVLAAQGLVVKHVDAAELRVVVGAVLAVAANAVLVA